MRRVVKWCWNRWFIAALVMGWMFADMSRSFAAFNDMLPCGVSYVSGVSWGTGWSVNFTEYYCNNGNLSIWRMGTVNVSATCGGNCNGVGSVSVIVNGSVVAQASCVNQTGFFTLSWTGMGSPPIGLNLSCTPPADSDTSGQCNCTDTNPCSTHGGDSDGDGCCADVDCNDGNSNYCSMCPPCDGHGGDADNDGCCADVDCNDSDATKCAPEQCSNTPCLARGGDADMDGCCADVDCNDNDANKCAPETCQPGPCDGHGGDADGDGCCADVDCNDGDRMKCDAATCACDNKGGDADGDGCCADDDCDDGNRMKCSPSTCACPAGDADNDGCCADVDEDDHDQDKGCGKQCECDPRPFGYLADMVSALGAKLGVSSILTVLMNGGECQPFEIDLSGLLPGTVSNSISLDLCFQRGPLAGLGGVAAALRSVLLALVVWEFCDRLLRMLTV